MKTKIISFIKGIIICSAGMYLTSCGGNGGSTTPNTNNSADTINTSLVTVDGRTSNLSFSLDTSVAVSNHSYDPPGSHGCNTGTIFTINSMLTGKMIFFLLNSNNPDASEDVIIKIERMDYSFDVSPCDITDCRKVAPPGPPLKHVDIKFDATWNGNFMGFEIARCCVTKSKISISNFTVVGNTVVDGWILESVKKQLLAEFDAKIAHEICKKMNNNVDLPAGDDGHCGHWAEMQ